MQHNAPAHTSQVAMAAATKCSFKVFAHPPYSPDLAASDVFLFPNLKTHLCDSNEGAIDAVSGIFSLIRVAFGSVAADIGEIYGQLH